MLSIQTPYALCGDDLVHISERTYKERNYLCPVCFNTVAAKKGPTKTHHFYHVKKLDCPATPETLLHATAKQYILRNENVVFQFSFQFFYTTSAFFDLLESRLGIQHASLSLDHILDYYSCDRSKGKEEKKIGSFIADLLFASRYEDSNEEFVIEILMTHETEEPKHTYFLENQIPYIEVRPEMHGDKIVFIVVAANIPEYLQESHINLRENIYSLFFNDFKKEILQDLQTELTDSEKIALEKKSAIEELKEVIPSLNLRDYINGQQYRQMMTIPITGSGKVEEYEQVTRVDLSEKNLKINGKYVNYENRILESLIKHLLASNVPLHAFTEPGYNRGTSIVTGFGFTFPNEKVTGNMMKDILFELTNTLVDRVTDEETDNDFPF